MEHHAAERSSRREIYIRAGVEIEDPSGLPGLIPRVSREAVPVNGIPFDTKETTGRKVDCALCGRKENHFRGFVVSFADDTLAIIGRDCGERELFDQGAWKAMEASAEQRKLQALYVARSAPAIQAIDELLLPLDRCEASIRALTAFLNEVREHLHDLHYALTGPSAKGGQLVRYYPQRRVYVNIPTVAPYRREKFLGLLLRVRQGVQRARRLLDQQEGVTLVEQEEAFKILGESYKHFQELHSSAELASAYLTTKFWRGVIEWANAEPNRFYSFEINMRMIRCDDDGEAPGVQLPETSLYSLEAFAAVRNLWPRL